jgi:abortive infection bacteriophage resistance protein
MSTYNKPYITFNEQLNLLKSRGLEITDDAIALEYLRRLGYYRLSGYWYPCRKIIPSQAIKPVRPQREDKFMPGSRFQDVVGLYVFDKKLRLIILDAIERVEVAIRVDIAYQLGSRDSFAYNNSALLHGNFTKKTNPKTGLTRHEEWLEKHDQLISRSKEDFAEHYKFKYGLPLPIWVAIELWDFGLLSKFYQGMTVNDKEVIAKKYNVPNWQIMESWLRCLNYVRNVVAHHGRLWNRNLIDQPKLGARGDMPEFAFAYGNVNCTSRVYIVLCMLAHLMEHVSPRSLWCHRVVDLISSFPQCNYFSAQDMGCPVDWLTHPFWM